VPTKKQRRRQQKNRRHDWEYVYVDDEGNEVEVDPAELRTAKDEKERPRASSPQRRTNARGRPVRQIEPPSWRRVGRRALLLGPVFVVALLLLNRDQPIAASIVPAVFLLLFFIPFSYFTDSLAYRMYQKRVERSRAPAAKEKPKAKAR
jgi:cytochrome c-type biogenesis protein CcmH/NrfG